jgi:hypothetical protein
MEVVLLFRGTKANIEIQKKKKNSSDRMGSGAKE